MQFAHGDTANPLVFAIHGVHSPFGAAQECLLRMVRGKETLAEVVGQIDDLLSDCDAGHTVLQVKLPQDADAHALAVQWAIVSPQLLSIIAELREKAVVPMVQQSRSDFARASVVYDMLLTRYMTFVKNGI